MGVLANGYLKKVLEVNIGGVRTNIRALDIVAGGSIKVT